MKKAPKKANQPLHCTSRPTEDQIDQLWYNLRRNLWMAPFMNDTIKRQLEIIAQARQEASIAEDVLGKEINVLLDSYRWCEDRV